MPKPIEAYYEQARVLLDHLHGYRLDLTSGDSAAIFEHDRHLVAAQFQAADERAESLAKNEVFRDTCTCPPLESGRALHHTGCPTLVDVPLERWGFTRQHHGK